MTTFDDARAFLDRLEEELDRVTGELEEAKAEAEEGRQNGEHLDALLAYVHGLHGGTISFELCNDPTCIDARREAGRPR